jgi:hypothetical protein
MGKFIDDATIEAIIREKCDDVEKVIDCNLSISSFGKIGEKTYFSRYENNKGEIVNYKISGELYTEYYNKINNK